MKTVMLRNLEVGAGVPKVIVPIVAATTEGILAKAAEFANYDMDIVEWRVDFYDDVHDLKNVLSTLKALNEALGDTPVLFTIRSKKEGGEKDISVEEHAATVIAAVQSGYADAIDVEIFSGDDIVRKIIDAAHTVSKVVVGSSHDFGGTPKKSDIIYRLHKMQDMGADLLKLAVMPKSPADVITLLDATQEMVSCYAERPVITMSMGNGVITRLCGEYFGSAATFGAVGQVSAPGQIPVEQLKTAMDILHRGLTG